MALVLVIAANGLFSGSNADADLPKDKLTREYLQGRWCSVYGGQEYTERLFHEDGSYQIGFPAGSGYALRGRTRSLEEFRNGFERLIEFEPDTFTTIDDRDRTNVYTRGACG